MININKNFKVRKNVKIKNENGKIIVYNNSLQKGFLIFTKLIYCKNKSYKISNKIKTISGEGCQVKILNKKFRVVQNIEQNSINYLDDINKITIIGITVLPNTVIEIDSINIEFNYNKDKELEEKFRNDILLICPGYPSYENKYKCAFIHSRMQAYKNSGLKVDLAVVNENYINKSVISSFENIEIVSTGYNDVRKILQTKKYKKILIHFFDKKYAQILDATDLSDTNVILYSHGSDTLYRAWDQLNAKYFENITEVPSFVKESFKENDQLIARYNEMDNVSFVFVSNWAKKLSEKLIGIEYKNAYVIPCNIDQNIFNYEQKNKELRKKIFVIRRYDNLSTYAIDIAVKVILELSNRKIFSDLEFSFYGDGDYHDVLLKPLEKFSNVHIYKI